MRHLLLSLLFACCFTSSYSQTPASRKHTISGYVRESGSGELLIGVTVYLPQLKIGTATNTYGFYSLTLPTDSLELVYSFVGYRPEARRLLLNQDLELNISLSTETTALNEVVVNSESLRRMSENPQMSVVEIPIQQIKDIPALMGEKDVLKVLQLMPGVQKGSEGNSGLYVRGGGPDQNLIILDDATVYNAYHLFGFFSLFNGDALKSVELIKGGFPARYGGRLSSVVEMNMKEGNKEALHGEAGIGLISSRLTLEGPIVKNKASFLVSGRRTYLDLLLLPFLPAEEKFGYNFYDLTTKVNYDFGRKDKLYLSGYFGQDGFFARSTDKDRTTEGSLKWGNATGTLRWNHLFNNQLFANASLIFSNYRFNIYQLDEDKKGKYELEYRSGIRDFSFKYDLDFLPNPKHSIRAGFQTTFHRFTPSAVVVKDSDINKFEQNIKNIDAQESGLYVEDTYRPLPRLTINAGFRLSHFLNKGQNYLNPEPRLSAAYKLRDDLALKASYATMNQYIHLLSNTGIGLPTDLWVPSTNQVRPQRSDQVALGIAKDFTERNLALTVEGYYKKSKNVIGYKEGASFLLIDDPTTAEELSWEQNITSGQSWSYGAEVLLQRKSGRFSGWLGYTLSWTQLQFDELNFGRNTSLATTGATIFPWWASTV
jgi:outer membrane cobalamin receptor